MKSPSDHRRRFAANLVLGSAAAMVLAGLTVFESRLRGVRYLLYWTTCYILTMSALLLAIWDAWIASARIAREEAELEAESVETLARDITDPPPRNAPRVPSHQPHDSGG